MPPSVNYKKAAIGVFFLAFLVRTIYLNIPLIEPYNNITRQTVVGMVARNFYQHGFNFFYPELDDNGAGPYLFNAEMPVYSYLMAIGYWLVGGVKEWAARLVSVIFSMGMLWILYRFVRRLHGEQMAFFTLLIAAFCPLNVALSRSIQPEATMLFASVGAIYAFYLYQETGRLRYYWTSAVFMALALAVKAYTVYLFLPLALWVWKKQRARIFTDYRNYFYLLFSCLPLAWYVSMWFAGKHQALAYSTISYIHGRGEDYSNIRDIFSFSYLYKTSKIFVLHILTPAGALFFIMGFFERKKEETDFLFRAWFFSIALFLLIFWRTAVEHSYYQLPLVPAVSFYIAKGIVRALENLSLRRVICHPFFLTAIGAVTLVTLFHFYQRLYFIPKELHVIVEAGKALDRIAPKQSLVIGSYESSPAQLYYCNRKGWAFDMRQRTDDELIGRFEALHAKGASYFVISNLKEIFLAQGFYRYLKDHYPISEETPRYLIFKLSAQTS